MKFLLIGLLPEIKKRERERGKERERERKKLDDQKKDNAQGQRKLTNEKANFSYVVGLNKMERKRDQVIEIDLKTIYRHWFCEY